MSIAAFMSRFKSPSPWFASVIIVVAVLIASLWFLWPAPLEFPMDDTYIHFVYAQNLAEHGEIMFNYPNEDGVGTTSLLWVLLLAGGLKLGIPMHLLAKVLGAASLILVGLGLYLLLRSTWRPLPALVSVLLIVLSGTMLWFSMSGMETVLFLLLGILALLAYQKEKWGWLGITLGLLILTRPEGVALVLVIVMVDIWHRKGIHKGIVFTVLIVALISLPWFGYLFWRTGHLLPTSAVGKMLSSRIGISTVVERNESLAVIGQFPAIIYPGLWLVYILEFVLGGIALPPPRIPVGAILGINDYTYSIWALLALVIVIIPLAWAGAKRVGNIKKVADWSLDDNRRPMVIFMAWLLLHNLFYTVVLPVPGTASRYGALNHIALWILLTIGLFTYLQSSRRYLLLAVGLGIIAVANTVYWNGVYDANIDHMQEVRIEATRYLNANLKNGEQCAAFDIGALSFFSDRPIIDLGGLIEPTLGQIYQEGNLDRYLVDSGATCMVIPGRTGTTQDGFFDFATLMGITDTPLFELQPVAVFEIDRQRWLQGYLPTANYQATVTIYELAK